MIKLIKKLFNSDPPVQIKISYDLSLQDIKLSQLEKLDDINRKKYAAYLGTMPKYRFMSYIPIDYWELYGKNNAHHMKKISNFPFIAYKNSF